MLLGGSKRPAQEIARAQVRMQLQCQDGLLHPVKQPEFLVRMLLNGCTVSQQVVIASQAHQHRDERSVVVERLAERPGAREVLHQLRRPKALGGRYRGSENHPQDQFLPLVLGCVGHPLQQREPLPAVVHRFAIDTTMQRALRGLAIVQHRPTVVLPL